MAQNREDLIYLSKISEQTERFEDMLSYMKQVVKFNNPLNTEERNLLSVAYKNSVGSRRTAWRALSSIQQKEDSKGSKYSQHLMEYKIKIEKELDQFCNDILDLIETVILQNCENSESKVFFLKMQGDYHRYISEYAQNEQYDNSSQQALVAYKKAVDIAKADLKTTNPVRLGLFLNFSVFCYEVLNDPTQACELAKLTFDEAIADIEHIDEDQYKDATTIMQLIRDNLTLWTSEMDDENQEDQ